ncbi:helix-turn-helix transcriptional regulator [Asinibacterium sp. OR53]|jgi:transcriptional regulator with XRE-family HTH domain|uniref:helix-turn-helix domain-containing protein n=1 Tax=Asinibacterium sp. OR53 TaxID=925409 RepID=UPI0006889AA6|nr:helix-turn-helix transcriptional regulator [Asinibacterium sp. OR53]
MKSKTVDRLLRTTPKDVEIFVDWYADLVININRILREKGITQKELAQKLGKQPSEISKWLNDEHNFTLRSLAKLQAELGETLLEVPERQAHTEFVGSGYSRSVHRFVVYQKEELKTEAKLIKWQPIAEINSLSNVG